MPALDSRQIADALRELYAPCAPGGFQRQFLGVVQRLVPGLHYTWDEFRWLGERPELHSLNNLWDVMPMQEFFDIYTQTIGQHPTVLHTGSTPGVHLETDFATRAEWERTDFFHLLLKPYGIRHQLAAQVRTDFIYGGR